MSVFVLPLSVFPLGQILNDFMFNLRCLWSIIYNVLYTKPGACAVEQCLCCSHRKYTTAYIVVFIHIIWLI